MSRTSKFFRLLAWTFACALAVFQPARADIVIVPSIPYILQNGTLADASQVMADFNAIISYVNTNAAGNGTNSSITSLTGLASPPAGAGAMKLFGITADVGGTANAITISGTYPGGFTLLNAGPCIWFKPALTNTGAATINVNSTGAVAIKRMGVNGLSALQGGELVPGVASEICYDGTQYILENPVDVVEGPLPYTNVASAATTTLSASACPNFKCTITGLNTITSFGTSATAGQIFYLQFTGGSTLTYNAVSMILPGAASILTAPQDTAAALYLGGGNWQVLFYTAAIQQFNAVGGLTPQANGLVIVNDGTNPSTSIDVTAQSVGLTNSIYTASVSCTNINLTINTNSSGGSSGNDLDTGSRANGTWYYVYIISNGVTCAGLASVSSTSPTLPTGYIYFMRAGAMATDGSANFYRTRQNGRNTAYTVVPSSNTPTLPVLVSGATGSLTTPTWTSVQVTGNGKMAPPTASQVTVVINNTSSSGVMVAPNGNYGAYTSNANPSPCLATNVVHNSLCPLVLESNSIYAASSAAESLVFAYGWTDAVAAN